MVVILSGVKRSPMDPAMVSLPDATGLKAWPRPDFVRNDFDEINTNS